MLWQLIYDKNDRLCSALSLSHSCLTYLQQNSIVATKKNKVYFLSYSPSQNRILYNSHMYSHNWESAVEMSAQCKTDQRQESQFCYCLVFRRAANRWMFWVNDLYRGRLDLCNAIKTDSLLTRTHEHHPVFQQSQLGSLNHKGMWNVNFNDNVISSLRL